MAYLRQEQGCLQISQGAKGVVSRKFALIDYFCFQSVGRSHLPIIRCWVGTLLFLPLHLDKRMIINDEKITIYFNRIMRYDGVLCPKN